MLHVAGTVLEVSSRTIGQPGNQFVSTTVAMMTGKASVERVRLGRDITVQPEEGAEVVYECAVSAYSGKNGPGVQITALRDVTDRVAALLPA